MAAPPSNPRSIVRRLLAIFLLVVGLAAVVGIAGAGNRLERPFLRLGGAIIKGVSDHMGAAIVVAGIAFVLVWGAIGYKCYLEGREEDQRPS